MNIDSPVTLPYLVPGAGTDGNQLVLFELFRLPGEVLIVRSGSDDLMIVAR